jgi:ankyrin repeat protein
MVVSLLCKLALLNKIIVTTLPHISTVFRHNQLLAQHLHLVMSQAGVDAFVDSAACNGTLTPEGVFALVKGGITVNGRNSRWGATALHYAVYDKRRELVVALLAAGADANVRDDGGRTSVWWGAAMPTITADIMQLLIDGGGSVNKLANDGMTPLIALVSWNGDAAARLRVLLARPELDLDATFKGKTADRWAEEKGHPDLAQAIGEERGRRKRWSALRSAWIAAPVTPSI